MLRIVRVLAPNPSVYTLEGTNTWIVGDDPSIVIDPGPADVGHRDEVARAAGRVAAVLVTHDHEDHAPGAPAFAELVGAPLYAFRLKGADHLRDGQRFATSDQAEVVAEYTPGHSSDHVAFFVPSDGALFTGDAVVGRGTSFVDPPDGDLVQYLRSLRRMQELKPRTIYPGHGPIVVDDRDLVRSSGRHIDVVMGGHRPDSSRAREIHDLRDDLSAVGIEDDRPPGIHVVHVDATTCRIDTLVVEAIRGPRQRDLT
jgi:glyoxylase-like metal-dependent hydrolase (beta-lactamase superfamily II)